MKIDAEKPTPKYLQLKEILKHHLRDERYRADQKIPSESELMAQFHVSRSTIRQTLSELVKEGILYKKQGLGSFFSGNPRGNQTRSYLIGVIVPGLSFYIYPQIIQGINDIVHQKRYNIVLGSSDTDPKKEPACLEQLLEKNIDGLLFEPSIGPQQFLDSKTYHLLQALTIPVVFMDWALAASEVSYVSLDDVEGGFRATSYLIETGHRHIAYVYPNTHVPGIQRYQGYRKALAAHGIEYDPRLTKTNITLNWRDTNHGYLLMKELIALGTNRPTAVFFFNDETALQAYAAIREAGLKIPDDMSVMGFDDSDLAVLAETPLTTMIHPKYQIGKWAAEILCDQIEHQGRNTPQQMILHPGIAVRNSVKKLS
ncbi:MAG: GntR family transcriptional regulator [Candidatus Vecturithrix sp.]|jgi:GntR family transcriptional regulator of arabinose operon|nr:GntR family transcriptional regulator [Candidatus Vecturithrix sp.]